MNYVGIVQLCENVLGFVLPRRGSMPMARVRAMEAGKLKKAMAAQPGVSFEDLELAIQWSWNKRLRVSSPTDLLYRVDDARKLAAPRYASNREQRRQEAISTELFHQGPDYFEWISRLQMTTGKGLDETLREWESTRRELLSQIEPS